jgi:hypothetical protein
MSRAPKVESAFNPTFSPLHASLSSRDVIDFVDNSTLQTIAPGVVGGPPAYLEAQGIRYVPAAEAGPDASPGMSAPASAESASQRERRALNSRIRQFLDETSATPAPAYRPLSATPSFPPAPQPGYHTSYTPVLARPPVSSARPRSYDLYDPSEPGSYPRARPHSAAYADRSHSAAHDGHDLYPPPHRLRPYSAVPPLSHPPMPPLSHPPMPPRVPRGDPPRFGRYHSSGVPSRHPEEHAALERVDAPFGNAHAQRSGRLLAKLDGQARARAPWDY